MKTPKFKDHSETSFKTVFKNVFRENSVSVTLGPLAWRISIYLVIRKSSYHLQSARLSCTVTALEGVASLLVLDLPMMLLKTTSSHICIRKRKAVPVFSKKVLLCIVSSINNWMVMFHELTALKFTTKGFFIYPFYWKTWAVLALIILECGYLKIFKKRQNKLWEKQAVSH